MGHQIESILRENRSFPPSAAFRARARISDPAEYERLYRESLEQPEVFWGRVARELPWLKPFERVLDWSAKPFAKWFVGGRTNASYVCLDQHLTTHRRDKFALVWEGEPGEVVRYTYAELHAAVCRYANVLKARGVKKGERVALYMPMIPELVIAVLACARIGAVHSVIFGGFSAQSIRDRVEDGGCTAVITADGGWRRGKVLPLKPVVDEALAGLAGVHTVFVVRRGGNLIEWKDGRDVWLDELAAQASPECPPEPMDSEDTLFLLYTSGSTGKPKGIRHTTGGYLVGAYLSARFVFDLRDDDLYWCTADVGWVTGHSYVIYGPLANGASVLLYEGAPNTPHPGRFWELVAKHKVSVLYTAPTAIRSFMRWGDEHVTRFDRSSLRLLGTVGEPINPEAWMWYREVVGESRCPIVDTWWQTETGSIQITPLPGITAAKPGSATRPFFGVDAAVVDEHGNEVGVNQGGYLVLRKPWPAMLRGIHGDDARYVETYWSKFGGRYYFTGDGARKDQDGCFWIMGRVDDVLNVAGHRLSTMEIESALVSHAAVVEAAVVGRPDEISGEALCAFVTIGPGHSASPALAELLKEHVAKEIGKLARPAEVRFAEALPKTRSGKIMRRLLRDIAAGREVRQDTSTLEDFSVLARLRGDEE
ncbi:MAG: acetate--CoA ligase [Planctomycetes bacterium]|nr:acetate--CoA ligase [Planctomycetota bacterium]